MLYGCCNEEIHESHLYVSGVQFFNLNGNIKIAYQNVFRSLKTALEGGVFHQIGQA